MEPDRNLASWLVSHRREIESAMNAQLGPAALAAGSPESEALRRFRSFLSSSLVHGENCPPALDGLSLNERRVMALIDAWTRAATQQSAGVCSDLRGRIAPFVEQFRIAIRVSQSGRRARGTPRVSRRAVVAAIDRVADANPAAGSLLGVHRDALLGVDALSFVPATGHPGWWTQLDAMTEDGDTRCFGARLVDAAGGPVDVEASMTRFATRGRVLALVMVRPRAPAPPLALG